MRCVVLGMLLLAACTDATDPGPQLHEPLRTPVDLSAAAQGAGRFVAVGTINSLSRDGDLYFLTPGSDSAVIVWSSDAVTWTRAELEERGGTLQDVAYGNGTFVAVGSRLWERGHPLLLESATGEHWTAVRDGPALEWGSIEFGKGIFLATGISPLTQRYVVARSADGTQWESLAEFDLYEADLVFGDDTFVLYGDVGGVAYSSDGQEWTGHPIPDLLDIQSISYLDGRFLGSGTHDCCHGEIPEAIRFYTVLSENGRQWSAVERSDRLPFVSHAFGNRSFVAVTLRGAFASDDPLTGWTPTLVPETYRAPDGESEDWFTDVTFAGGQFVLVGRRKIFTSPDGRNWNGIPIP